RRNDGERDQHEHGEKETHRCRRLSDRSPAALYSEAGVSRRAVGGTEPTKRMRPPGGGGRSIRRTGGETAAPDGWPMGGSAKTILPKISSADNKVQASSRTAPQIRLSPARSLIPSAACCRAARQRAAPASRPGRATAATRRRHADRRG